MPLINYRKYVNYAIVIVISIAFIFIGGVFIYKHESVTYAEKNPIYFALGIAFAGSGGKLVSSMVLNSILPPDIKSNLQEF
jgi:hypothetical protein